MRRSVVPAEKRCGDLCLRRDIVLRHLGNRELCRHTSGLSLRSSVSRVQASVEPVHYNAAAKPRNVIAWAELQALF
jgi:hypothetical protein